MKMNQGLFKCKVWLDRPWLFLLLLNLLLRLFAALRPLAIIDALPLPDDAYISLGLARNIANGLGSFFGGEISNGFQPLYVFLMVPVFWIFPNHFVIPVHVALVLLALFDTLALYLVLRLLEKLGKSALSIALVAASWTFSFYRMQMAVNGLETVIAFFFIIAAFSYYVKMKTMAADTLNRRSFFCMGILLGLAALARIDNTVLALVIAMALIIQQRRKDIHWPRQLKNMAWLVAGGTLVYLPWLIYSFIYTGQIFPVSGKAVRLISLGNARHHAPYIKEAISEIIANNFLLIACTGTLLVACFIIPAGRPRKIVYRQLLERFKNYHVPLGFCLLLTGAYVFYFYGFWAFFRYLYPVSLLLLLYAGEIFDCCIESIQISWQRKLFFASLLALLLLGNAWNPIVHDLFFVKEPRHSGYMNLGLWARDNFKNGTVVGSGQSGALEYFASNLKVINLDGVVNTSSYRALKQKRFTQYVREIGLQYILGWDSEFRFFQRFSANYQKGELVLLKKITEFYFGNQRYWKVYRVNHAFTPATKARISRPNLKKST